MPAPKPHHVHREGNGRTVDVDTRDARSAYQFIGQTIADNGHGSKADAQRFAATVRADGTPATFGPYTFILTRI